MSNPLNVALVVIATATLRALAAEPDLAKLTWLAGCWASDTGEPGTGEQWTRPAGGTMLGMSRTVRGGKAVEFEFMQIRVQPDGRLAFIAQPSGRPPTAFPLRSLTNDEAVFENGQHDFPQRVVYGRSGASQLRARIDQ